LTVSYNGQQVSEYAGSSGSLLWRDTFSNPIDTIPTIGNNTIFLGYYNSNKVAAISLLTGQSAWNFTANTVSNEIVNSSPAYSNGSIFFTTLNGTVYRVSATGQMKWTTSIGAPIESSPAVADGLVFAAADNGHMFALNATTGLTVWEFPTASRPGVGSFRAAPLVSANGILYDGSTDNRTYAIVVTTGTELWNYTTSASITSSPALNDGILFVINTAGIVYAFGDTDHQFLFDWANWSNSGKVQLLDAADASICFDKTPASPLWAKCRYWDLFLQGKITLLDIAQFAIYFDQAIAPPFPGQGQPQGMIDPIWRSQCSYLPPFETAYCSSGYGYSGT